MPPDAISLLADQITALATEVHDLRGDVIALQISLAERRGERRAAVYFASTIAAVVSSALTLAVRYIVAGVHV